MLTKRSKRHFKENILRHAHKFHVSIQQNCSDKEIQEYYQLYLNVKNNSLALNTFTLPVKFFENCCRNINWEVIRIEVLSETGNHCAGFVLAQKQGSNYAGIVVGLNYSLNAEHNVYRRAIYEVLLRANSLNCTKVNLGFSAGIEKRKFGAEQLESCAYLQVKDNFEMSALYSNSVTKKLKSKMDEFDTGGVLSVQ